MEKSIKPPSLIHTIMELRFLYEVPFCLLSNFLNYPSGDGHPVLILPGFFSNDAATYPIKKFLRKLSYNAHGWRLGFNFGHSSRVEADLVRRLYGIYHYYERKVSIVGWSLGGILGRELAKKEPDKIRSVITLGSPFNHITACTNLKWLYQLVGRRKIAELKKEIDFDTLCVPPPIPTTSIYSYSDGVVHWGGCRHNECGDLYEDVPVWSSHIGLGFNLGVYHILANRLSQPEGNWVPYSTTQTQTLALTASAQKGA